MSSAIHARSGAKAKSARSTSQQRPMEPIKGDAHPSKRKKSASSQADPARNQQPMAVFQRIQSRLQSGLHGHALDQCLEDIARLSPNGCEVVLNGLHGSGLDKLLKGLSTTQKATFLALLSQRGIIRPAILKEAKDLSARTTDNQRRWGIAPNPPVIFVNHRNLPSALRKFLHKNNTMQAQQYRFRYQDYLDLYKTTVIHGAKGKMAAIRRSGPPHPPCLLNREPGVALANAKRVNAALDPMFRNQWWQNVRGINALDAQKEISSSLARAVHRSRDEMSPGQLAFQFEASIHVHQDKIGVAMRIDDDGHKSDLEPKTELTFGPVAYASQIPTENKTGEIGGEPKGAVKGKLGNSLASISASSDGAVEASLGFASAGFNSKGNIEVAASADIGLAEIKAGAEFRPGISAKELSWAFGDEGFFDVPQELEDGHTWNSLASERQSYLEGAHGWSKTEWEAYLRGRQDLLLPVFIGG